MADFDYQYISNYINEKDFDLIWVSLGAPKQEIFMNILNEKINKGLVLGVGAAFDVVAGIKKRSPLWMQKTSLEWLYRLWQDPKRLFMRYITTNSLFIYYILKKHLFKFSNHL